MTTNVSPTPSSATTWSKRALNAKARQSGFTLIELAMVTLIVAITIGALAIPLSTKIVESQTTTTYARLQQANDAILGFAILNRRMPCPDIIGNDGLEDTLLNAVGNVIGCAASMGGAVINTDVTGASWGDLPWATLGVTLQDSSDAWNNRIRYSVYTRLVTQALNPADTAQARIGFGNLTDPGNTWLRVQCHAVPLNATLLPAPGCPPQTVATASTLSTNVTYVLYSHGPNLAGGTPITGTVQIPSRPVRPPPQPQ